jgi:hypothetical protein
VADLALRSLAEIMRRAARPDAGRQPRPGLRRYVQNLSEQHEQVMAVRRMYWRTRARLRHTAGRVGRG